MDTNETSKVSKAEQARAIFGTMHAQGARSKDIIAAIGVQCNLNPRAAATYLHNARAKAGLVKSKNKSAE